MRKTNRSSPQTIDQRTAIAAITPSASISENVYSTPPNVSVTTPGLSASHIRPQPASATAARRINTRNILSPLSRTERRGRALLQGLAFFASSATAVSIID